MIRNPYTKRSTETAVTSKTVAASVPVIVVAANASVVAPATVRETSNPARVVAKATNHSPPITAAARPNQSHITIDSHFHESNHPSTERLPLLSVAQLPHLRTMPP
jgi:hypothetical protein